jgi:hypothetical protein
MTTRHATRLLITAVAVLTIVCTVAPVLAGFAGTDVFLPSVGRGPGSGGSVWYTTVWIHNPDASPALVRVYLLERDKDNSTSPSYTVTVPSGDTQRLEDTVWTLFGKEVFGALRITSDRKVDVSSRIYSRKGELADSVGQFFAGVPASFAISAGQTTELLGVYQTKPAADSDFRYNYGFVETTGRTVTVRVTPMDQTGAPLATAKDYVLRPFEQKQRGFKDDFPAISTENARLQVTVLSGTGKVVAFGSGLANGSQDPSTFEMKFRDELLGGTGTGLLTVSHDATLAGDGTTASPLGLANNAVTTTKIADAAVTSPKLAPGAVTQAKMLVGGTVANGKVVGTDGTNLLWLAASGMNLPYRGSADTSGWVLELTNTAVTTLKGGILGQTGSPKGFGVWGENTSPTAEGSGLFGQTKSASGFGVWGNNTAVTGAAAGVKGTSASSDGIGVLGLGLATGSGIGVLGQVSTGSGVGVKGLNLSATANAYGVFGQTQSSSGTAVKGLATSTSGSVTGVFGEVSSTGGIGVKGQSNALTGTNYGVFGENRSAAGAGVRGVYVGSGNGVGVSGYSNTPLGIGGHFSANGHGVVAISHGAGVDQATLDVENTNNAGIAVYAIQESTEATIRGINIGTGDLLQLYSTPPDGTNMRFRVRNTGNVFADGSYNCGLASGCFNSGAGADLAERIDVAETLEPGDVVEIDPAREGHFRLSRTPLSTLVAGVVSTSPAMTMNNNDLAGDPDERTETRPLLALVGQVPVKVTDEGGNIAVGDLLVASSTPGHAMRCADRHLCAGAVVGKALQTLAGGRGVILMLATLQ